MNVTSIVSLLAATLTTLVPASCHKTTTAKTTTTPVVVTVTNPNTNVVSSNSNLIVAANSTANINVTSSSCELGEVLLTNRTETCVKIDATKQCIFTTKLLDHKNAQITLAFENKGSGGSLAMAQIVTKSNQPFEVAVGDYSLSFTPKISE